jgi:molybdopterin converting factor small subunit
MQIRVVLAGRNYHAAQTVPTQLALPDAATLDDALAALSRHIPAGSDLPDTCLVAVCGVHLGTVRRHRPRVLQDGDELLLLAPVAGG